MTIQFHGIVPSVKHADLICLDAISLDSGPTLRRITARQLSETQTEMCLTLELSNRYDIDEIADELMDLFVSGKMELLRVNGRRIVLVQSAVATAIRVTLKR